MHKPIVCHQELPYVGGSKCCSKGVYGSIGFFFPAVFFKIFLNKAKTAPELARKKQRVTTEHISQQEFERVAGVVVEEAENPGFGRWLAGQQFGDSAQFYDATAERERADAKAWFEKFKEEEERKRKRKEEEELARNRGDDSSQRKRKESERRNKQPPPPLHARQRAKVDPVKDSLMKIGISVAVESVTSEMISQAKKAFVLRHHPDKQPVGTTPEQIDQHTVLFRVGMEALGFLKKMQWPSASENNARKAD
jgi:hypothetical protein